MVVARTHRATAASNCFWLLLVASGCFWVLVAASGDYADWQHIKESLTDLQMENDCLNDSHVLSASAVYSYLTRVLYSKNVILVVINIAVFLQFHANPSTIFSLLEYTVHSSTISLVLKSIVLQLSLVTN